MPSELAHDKTIPIWQNTNSKRFETSVRTLRASQKCYNLLEVFSSGIIDDMLNSMVDYTSANIKHFRLKFCEIIELSD